MSLFLVIVCSSTVIHVAYNYYWKTTNLAAALKIGTDSTRGNYSTETMILVAVDMRRSSLSNATNVSVTSGTPIQTSVDVHVEDPVLGHTGEVTTDHADHVPRGRATIAVGGGITSGGIGGINESNFASQMLFYRYPEVMPILYSHRGPVDGSLYSVWVMWACGVTILNVIPRSLFLFHDVPFNIIHNSS